jgi:hypothetical protein
LTLSGLTTALMMVVAIWESLSLRSGSAKKAAGEDAQSEATSA